MKQTELVVLNSPNCTSVKQQEDSKEVLRYETCCFSISLDIPGPFGPRFSTETTAKQPVAVSNGRVGAVGAVGAYGAAGPGHQAPWLPSDLGFGIVGVVGVAWCLWLWPAPPVSERKCGECGILDGPGHHFSVFKHQL